MFNGSNCDEKSQFSGILTEPLNPCVKRLRMCGVEVRDCSGIETISKLQMKTGNEEPRLVWEVHFHTFCWLSQAYKWAG